MSLSNSRSSRTLFHHLHPRQCVSCEDESPTCNCAPDENCVLTSRTCSQCPTIQCNKKPGAGGGAVNPGVIAGPVVAVLVIASLVLFWYLRRKKRRDLARLEELAARARKAEIAGFHLSQPGSPVPGSARSAISARSHPSRHSAQPKRPQLAPAPMNAEYRDEHGGILRVYGGNGAINADPNHPDNGGAAAGRDRDPFADGDGQSFVTRSSGQTGQTGTSTNIIPIQFIPPSKSDDSLGDSAAGRTRPKSAAARTLNEAREILLRGGPPQRPARAPGLDLRLNANASGKSVDQLSNIDDRSPSTPGGSAHIRDSYLSGTSGAPSFSSGYTTDLHTDAPKIFTSKHVQLGRFQQAEVVQFGQQQVAHPPPALAHGELTNMEILGRTSALSPASASHAPISPPLSAVRSPYSEYGPTTAGPAGAYRTLTPTSGSNRRYSTETDGEGGAEEMPSPDPNHHPPANASPTDLRFSMGSLAYRDSVSSMGTERYHLPPAPPGAGSGSGFDNAGGVPLPRAPWVRGDRERESMMSGRSDADSLLGAYPMIPPSMGSQPLSQSGSGLGLPQSTSVATLDAAHLTSAASSPRKPAPPPPPPAFRSKFSPSSASRQRPQTQASIADSFLGSFPFVPPPPPPPPASASAESQSQPRPTATARNTAMSGVSEGLGAFDFRFGAEEGQDGPPPLPSNAAATTPR